MLAKKTYWFIKLLLHRLFLWESAFICAWRSAGQAPDCPLLDLLLCRQVRNHVLAKWRSNVRRWMSREEAGSRIMHKHQRLVDVAYRFLNAHGYINFGVAPPMVERCEQEPKYAESVVVIGAGLAGLAAAQQLKMHGYSVVVLEGRNRPGA